MKKNILILSLFLSLMGFAQKYQRIAYIDMNYILENIPQYNEVKTALESKVAQWRTEIDKETRAVEVLKTDLTNEKAILTQDLIAEREENIKIKQEKIRNLELKYFGPEGSMYSLRRELIKPIQDQVYNIIQNVASRKKYDFVFDKSSELIMLYSNKNHDISDLVLRHIGIEQTKQSRKEKIKKLQRKREEAKKRVESKSDEGLSKKEREAQERRRKLIEEREKKRQLLREKKEALKRDREEKSKQENK